MSKDFEFSDELYFIPIEKKYITEIKWDYNMGEGYAGTQKDWNQTLITKINQISAQIHKSTFKGGANIVKINPILLDFFTDSPYFNIAPNGDMNFLGRYKTILDNSIMEDEIIIVFEDNGIPEDFLLIPECENGQVDIVNITNDGIPVVDYFPVINLKLVYKNSLTKKELEEYYYKRQGKIKILNYELNR